MHRHEPFGFEIVKYLQRFIGSHVHMSERFRIICPDRQQSHLRRQPFSYFLKTLEVGAVPRVVNSAPLMFQHEPAVAAMLVMDRSRSPMLGWSQRHLPVAMR